MVLHVVTESASHAGHLGMARENIDGTQYIVLGWRSRFSRRQHLTGIRFLWRKTEAFGPVESMQ